MYSSIRAPLSCRQLSSFGTSLGRRFHGVVYVLFRQGVSPVFASLVPSLGRSLNGGTVLSVVDLPARISERLCFALDEQDGMIQLNK